MRHVEGLREALDAAGHDVRVFAPVDPPGLRSRIAHRGADSQRRGIPEWLTPVGSTVGIPANGAVSNLVIGPAGLLELRRGIKDGDFDIVHVQEPVAPVIGWDACTAPAKARVGTFHAYAENSLSNGVAKALGGAARLNHLHGRIAVSHAAEWTAKRFYGGRYTIIPNGTGVPSERPVKAKSPDGTLRVLFIGQAVERKGLPVLLRAFEALREHLSVELTLVGVDRETLAPLLNDRSGVRALGKVDDMAKLEELARADVLCAPSLGGESFGMVLTEAFAAGTPVVASDIAGYRDVATKGFDSVLVPPGDPVELALALRDLGDVHGRLEALGDGAWRSAQRFSWTNVADEVVEVYGRALEAPEPSGALERFKVRIGSIPSDLGENVKAKRLPPPDDTPQRRRQRIRDRFRRGAIGVAGLGAVVASAMALDRIGLDRIASALLGSKPSLVVLGLAIMCASMAVRAIAWDAILKAAMPESPVGFLPVLRATCIGVLMSATLPARLGEPARAMVISRRAGDPREAFPAVLGTIVSQTVLNLLALGVLGIVMFNSVPIFHGHDSALLWVAVVPLLLVALVLLAPVVLARGSDARSERIAQLSARARFVAAEVRRGLKVFRHRKLSVIALAAQSSAWVLQWLSCWVLLAAMGLDAKAGLGAAAAVLFAVNVTAAVPITPANLGVFQAACVAVLTAGYGVSASSALGYGIVLQAVELATAFIMGLPALLGEGITWREVRARTMHSQPVSLPARDS
ncbi:MAG: flippase-like domain-containing protein [Actinomycetes bacterium]